MYILVMSIPKIDLKKMKEFVDRREAIINKSIRTLSLGKNNTESTLNVFKGFLMSFLATQSPKDASYFSTKFSEVFTDMIQPLPAEELATTGINTLVHNKFATLAQSVLAHPMCDQFFHAAIKDGCKIMVKDITEINTMMSTMEAAFIGHLDELAPYIDTLKTNPELAFQTVVENNQPAITKLSEELYLDLFQLRASLQKHGNFSTHKVNSVEAKATELNTLLTGIDGLKSMPSSLGNLTAKLKQSENVWAQADRMMDRIDTISDVDTAIQDGIDFGSLFDKNVTKMLEDGRRVKDYCANLSTLAKGNINGLTAAAQEVTSMLPYIRSTMMSMAQKNLKQALFQPGANRDMLDVLKTTLKTLPDPLESFKTLERDIQGTLAMTSALMRGIIPHDTALPKLKNRMTTNFDVVQTFTDAAMGAFNDFNPYYDDTAAAAHQALKDTAPTPLTSLALGDIKSFQQALINPLAITAIGPAMSDMSDFIKNSVGLTVVDTMRANQLMDYLTQEFTRESITTYLADPDLQKAVAIQGLNKYKKTNIKPIKDLIEKTKLADDAAKQLYF